VFVDFRYGNIVPYDANRVKLSNPIEGIDYVNASWIQNRIPTPEMPRFIAAQGPIVHTIPHFLQMIIDHKVKAIVMLTKLKEFQQDSGESMFYLNCI
jgi:protein tyrosine phosphatase